MAAKKAKKTEKPEKWLSPVRCSLALQEAIAAYAKKHGVSVSDLVRTAIAEKIGKPELAVTPKPGWQSGQSRK